MTFSYLQICEQYRQYDSRQEDSRIEKGMPLIENLSTDISKISKNQKIKYLPVFSINSLETCKAIKRN